MAILTRTIRRYSPQRSATTGMRTNLPETLSREFNVADYLAKAGITPPAYQVEEPKKILSPIEAGLTDTYGGYGGIGAGEVGGPGPGGSTGKGYDLSGAEVGGLIGKGIVGTILGGPLAGVLGLGKAAYDIGEAHEARDARANAFNETTTGEFGLIGGAPGPGPSADITSGEFGLNAGRGASTSVAQGLANAGKGGTEGLQGFAVDQGYADIGVGGGAEGGGPGAYGWGGSEQGF